MMSGLDTDTSDSSTTIPATALDHDWTEGNTTLSSKQYMLTSSHETSDAIRQLLDLCAE
jgi:hypothetical protein